jgi:hypothetical protein
MATSLTCGKRKSRSASRPRMVGLYVVGSRLLWRQSGRDRGRPSRDGRSTVPGEQGVDVRDEPRNEARMFGAAPPDFAMRRLKQAVEECSTRRFESSLRKDTAFRAIPNVKSRPGLFGQHLIQPQLIGRIHKALSVQASGHELGNVAVLGYGHADHRPLRHRGIMLVPLERARVLSDL